MNSPYAKVRISNDFFKASDFWFLSQCSCQRCCAGRDLGAYFLTYKIGETNFYIDWMPGTISFWKGCPNSSETKPVLFEEFFEEAPMQIKETFIYHLDVFKR